MNKIQVGAVLVARMSSSRLPGKVLSEVNHKPLLKYTLERLTNSGLDLQLFVATSTMASDDPIEAFARENELQCIRGDLQDVAGRFGQVFEQSDVDALFRVNGDSPMIDVHLFAQALKIYRDKRPDLVSNIFPRTYPPGVSVELIDRLAFQRLLSYELDSFQKEHITQYFYCHPDRFTIVNIEAIKTYENLHLAVDTEEDLGTFKSIVEKMSKSHWEYGLDDLILLHADSKNHEY